MRRILAPKWLGFHVLAVLLVLVMLRLGWWQWHRAESPSGGLQNLGYAIQWPVFACFVVFMWWKTVRDELRRRARQDAPPATTDPREERQPVMGLTTPAEGATTDEIDDELAAYNRYLADLNARAGRRTR